MPQHNSSTGVCLANNILAEGSHSIATLNAELQSPELATYPLLSLEIRGSEGIGIEVVDFYRSMCQAASCHLPCLLVRPS